MQSRWYKRDIKFIVSLQGMIIICLRKCISKELPRLSYISRAMPAQNRDVMPQTKKNVSVQFQYNVFLLSNLKSTQPRKRKTFE